MRKYNGVYIKCDPVLMEFLLKLKQDRPALFGGAVEEVIDSNYIFFKNASPDLLDRLRPEVDNWMRSTCFEEEGGDDDLI